MTKNIKQIIFTLDNMFPNAECELRHNNEFQLLVAVMLSAQTTDVSVNKLTESLFKKYTKPEDFVNQSLEVIENDIKTIGLFRTKAKSLKGMSEKILTLFNGKVPSNMDDLVSLPGVGRKTANVVLAVAFNIPSLAVDTHVERVSKRLGLVSQNATVDKVEKELKAIIPKARWIDMHHKIIFFGRYHCKSKKPVCLNCLLKTICNYEN